MSVAATGRAWVDDHEEFGAVPAEIPTEFSHVDGECIALSHERIAELFRKSEELTARSQKWVSGTMESDDKSWSIPDLSYEGEW